MILQVSIRGFFLCFFPEAGKFKTFRKSSQTLDRLFFYYCTTLFAFGVFTNKTKMYQYWPMHQTSYDINLTFNKLILVKDIYTSVSLNVNYKLIHKILNFLKATKYGISPVLVPYYFEHGTSICHFCKDFMAVKSKLSSRFYPPRFNK